MDKDTTLENIVNGQGLQPISTTQTTSLPIGLTTEQKDFTSSGFRKDVFTRQFWDEKDGKG